MEQSIEGRNVKIQDWHLKCEHCDYKCKKVLTMKNRIKTKHEDKILTCNQ